MYGNRCGNAQTGTVTNFWVRKAMVGCQMFYDTKIADLKSPERAFFNAIISKMGLGVLLS